MNNYQEEFSCQTMIDNSKHILHTMQNLFRNQQMCDVFITVGKKEHGAHRLILCALSDVFQAMLMKPEWCEWSQTKIILQEDPCCENVFQTFLEYFYTGKILITHTNVVAILTLADKYIVKSLTHECVRYMCQHVAHAAAHNQLFSWLQYTVACGYADVATLCKNYIKWNFEAVANTPDFSNFEVELLCDILKQNDVVVLNEMVLYNCVSRWLDLQQVRLNNLKLTEPEVQEHMHNIVEAVMSCIRFPMMSTCDLMDLLLSNWLKQYSDVFLDRMRIGMSYQKGFKDEFMILDNEEPKFNFTPRLYTCDNYNTTLLIENVPCLPCYTVSTFVFSTHMSTIDQESDKISEWLVDLYPKGVCFKKCFLIVWQGTLEVPERIIPTVRISLTCREFKEDIKVRIGVLLHGTEGGTEHIMRVLQREHHFNSQDRQLVIDNFIPFEEFCPQASEKVAQARDSTSGSNSIYFTGPDRDKLKISIIITPLNCDKLFDV